MIGLNQSSSILQNIRKYLTVKILLPIFSLLFILLSYIYLLTTPEGNSFLSNLSTNYTIFINSLDYSFVQRALVASLIVGSICAIVGVFVLLRGIIFLGEAVTHSAFAGATFGILFAIEPIYTIIAFAITGAVAVGYVNEKKVMNDEIIIGVTFTFMMALAILFIGFLSFYSTQVTSILFGNLMFIPTDEFYLMIVIGILVTAVILFFRKELYFMTFDVEMAKLTGIPVRLFNYLFLILVALAISVSIRGIGAILVFAMIIVPAAAAYQWTFKLNRMITYSVIIGNIATLTGFIVSFMFNLPVGSVIVIIVTGIFFISFIYSPKREATKNILSCKYCNKVLTQGDECEDCLAKGIKHIHDGEATRISVRDLPEQEHVEHIHKEV